MATQMDPSFFERIQNILVNLMYLLGNYLGGLNIEYLQKLLCSFVNGYVDITSCEV